MTEATFGHSYFSSNENIYKKKKEKKSPAGMHDTPPPPPPQGKSIFTTNVQTITLKFRIKHYSRDLTQARNFRKQMNEVFSTCIVLIKVESCTKLLKRVLLKLKI